MLPVGLGPGREEGAAGRDLSRGVLGLQLSLAAHPWAVWDTLTRRRLVRRLMPSVSNLQEEGAGRGLAWVGWGGWAVWPLPGGTAGPTSRRGGVGGGYLGAWLMSGWGRYRGKL